MPSNPDVCECGSRLFTAVWAVAYLPADDEAPEKDRWNMEEPEPPNPKKGTTWKRQVGFECVECEAVQLTREIPDEHAMLESLDYPESADRDMVRE